MNMAAKEQLPSLVWSDAPTQHFDQVDTAWALGFCTEGLESFLSRLTMMISDERARQHALAPPARCS